MTTNPTPPSVTFGDTTVADLAKAYRDICQSYEDDGGIEGMEIPDFEGMVAYLATLNAYREVAILVNVDPEDVRLDDLYVQVQSAWSTREYLTEGTDEPLLNAKAMLET
jgi:hypothetical protein